MRAKPRSPLNPVTGWFRVTSYRTTEAHALRCASPSGREWPASQRKDRVIEACIHPHRVRRTRFTVSRSSSPLHPAAPDPRRIHAAQRGLPVTPVPRGDHRPGGPRVEPAPQLRRLGRHERQLRVMSGGPGMEDGRASWLANEPLGAAPVVRRVRGWLLRFGAGRVGFLARSLLVVT